MNCKEYDRISLDIDGKRCNTLFDMWRGALMLYSWDNVIRVEVWKSSGRKGFHVKAYLDEPVSFEEQIELRLFLGDDWNRVWRDIERKLEGMIVDFLFTHKYTSDNCGEYPKWRSSEFLFCVEDKINRDEKWWKR